MAVEDGGPLSPGATIGILGGGQLGRMLALAAARLGFKCHLYAPEGDNPAFHVAHRHTAAPYEDEGALTRFAEAVDVITYEFENVPLASVDVVLGLVPIAPGRRALEVAQDRLTEKRFIAGLGIAAARFEQILVIDDIKEALGRIGMPALLKTRRFGYDGKGQGRIAAPGDISGAWAAIGRQPAIIEAQVDFEREISVIAARARDGSIAAYDIPENRHEKGILRTSRVPAGIGRALAAEARGIAVRIAHALDYVGVLAVELFVERNSLLVNEIAPRVHNTGHWTLDACTVSQFEQHVRAIAGWPLGDPSRHSHAVMVNLLDEEINARLELAREPHTALHIYGKSEARVGRKMGHVTYLEPVSR